MPNQFLGFPFDPELFLLQWQAAQDPVLTALFDSAAVQSNGTIANLISNGSDLYTIPFYNVLGGEPDNYDGTSDIRTTATDGGSQSGVVYGRAHSWKAQDFVVDFNSGADPMKQITSQVAKYWQKRRQYIMLKILNGVFGTSDDTGGYLAEWQEHTTNIATTGASVAEANKLGATTAGDAIQKAVGDHASQFSLAWMHSKVANNLAGLNLLQFRKYTDPMGVERQLSLADFNGMTVIVDDGVPVVDSDSATGQKEYTTYLMGVGAIQYAKAPVKTPTEIGREAREQGGYDYLVTRLRETQHPNGFTYTLPNSGYTHSPTDAQLEAAAQWKIAVKPKNIAMAKIISNG